MGNHMSMNNTPGTSSRINPNPNNVAAELDKSLKQLHCWRKVLRVTFVVTVAAVFICSVVAAAVASPHVAATFAAVTAIPIVTIGTWIDSRLQKRKNKLKEQRAKIAARFDTHTATDDLADITVQSRTESQVQNADCATEEEAVKVVIEEMKK